MPDDEQRLAKQEALQRVKDYSRRVRAVGVFRDYLLNYCIGPNHPVTDVSHVLHSTECPGSLISIANHTVYLI